MKIGFIGAGNMASAIIAGAIASGSFPPQSLGACDICAEKARALAETHGITEFHSTSELLYTCDVVVLAVKPRTFTELLPAIREKLREKNPLVISIAAGRTLSYIEGLLGFPAPVVRIMPNINAAVGEAMTAYCCSAAVTREQRGFAESFCSSFGRAIDLNERDFPLFGVLAGSAPAYGYMFIDSLARAAVKNGMDRQLALQISAQTVLGSARRILESGEHPWELTDRVCSPGGTTIEGVLSLQRDGFGAAVAAAVDAALEKDRKL